MTYILDKIIKENKRRRETVESYVFKYADTLSGFVIKKPRKLVKVWITYCLSQKSAQRLMQFENFCQPENQTFDFIALPKKHTKKNNNFTSNYIFLFLYLKLLFLALPKIK